MPKTKATIILPPRMRPGPIFPGAETARSPRNGQSGKASKGQRRAVRPDRQRIMQPNKKK